MFTRFVECHVKPDKKDDFTNKLRNDVLPILQKQPGFVDLIGLVSENDPERIVSVSSGTASRTQTATIASTTTASRRCSNPA